jgi:hypothetical protein
MIESRLKKLLEIGGNAENNATFMPFYSIVIKR